MRVFSERVCVVKVSFVFSEAHALNGNKSKQREKGGSLSDTQWERETQGGENKKETQLGREMKRLREKESDGERD